ncbi:DUF1343 domain-containing protein [Candidatus Fermentibacteria bacterium]|nr:DUF1343 domain-containing protein [Candidatus Fermentibacteria bacterium]
MYRCALDGLEPGDLPGRRVGLLTHYAAVTSGLEPAASVLHRLGLLACIFGPQHGYWGETQDNMVEWEGYVHPAYDVPVHSLYGRNRAPRPSTLSGLDCLAIDLQDVGARYYTYVYAMALSMRAADRAGLPVVVLDRANPLGLTVLEGGLLNPEFESYVGMYPLPIRHGLSVGEMALYFARHDHLETPTVLRAEDPPLSYDDRLRPWVMPSPNMPALRTTLVYPGACLLEATNISEGRGTTRPFEIFGAPWLDGMAMASDLQGTAALRGAVLRPHRFIPTFGKYEGRLCSGAQIHVTDPSSFRSVRAVSMVLSWCFAHCPEAAWRKPPYEYEEKKTPMDVLAGGSSLRKAVESGDAESLTELTAPPLERYREDVEGCLLYERTFKE